MQFPESWLREFCNPHLSSEQLAEVLTMGGLEVEECHPVAPPFTGVVVGEIKEAVKHPDADRLRVCQVDVGAGELLNIVCGAPNARVGIRVPVATVGAELPPGEDGKPFKIKVGKLRGVQSCGMLCSARELGLSQDHAGLLELSADALLGQDIRKTLNLDEQIFTLKLTPNLAHCQSVYGVARELSALTGTELKIPTFSSVAVTTQDIMPVAIQAPDLCGRFSGRLVKNINLQAKTPGWMVRRLERCGQRSVSALVDISNYVMFELGQPTHIFDADKIHNGLTVRWGQTGETLELLNGNTIKVDDQVGVIADSQQLESLAGIMGGNHSAVNDSTKNIYIEAAFWWPKSIAGRSRRYNFSTDAGYRFERGVDPAGTVKAIEYITQLILDICSTPQTQCGPIADMQPNVPKRKPVTLRVKRAEKIIGVPVTQQQCAKVFQRLGLPFTEQDGVLTITPPSWRFDLEVEADLIEEVVRLIGYNNLPVITPVAPLFARVHDETERSPMQIRHALAARGYLETVNFSFVPRQWEQELSGNINPIQVLNPITSDLEVMRSSLLPSLINVLKQNLDRHAQSVRIFELAHVFIRDDSVELTDRTVKGIAQPRYVSGLIYGSRFPLQWAQHKDRVDFYDVKGDVEALFLPWQPEFRAACHPAMHPGRCAHVVLENTIVGVVGELHPKWLQQYGLAHSPVMFELQYDALRFGCLPKYVPISRFPSVARDVAFVVAEDVTCAQLLDVIKQAARKDGILKEVTLFDIYKPTKGVASDMPAATKSLAIRLSLSDENATLTDERINDVVAKVIEAVQKAFNAKLRS